MTDGELAEALTGLGVTRQTFRALALLPLVQVAWADGRIQARERELILALAPTCGLGEGQAEGLVERWVTRRPTATQFRRARQVLVELASRGDGLDSGDLTDVVAQCEQVARAAGGLFDLAFTVDEHEREVIYEIAEALSLGPKIPWDDLKA